MKVKPHEHLRYLVTSETDPKDEYLVDLDILECSCTDFQIRAKARGEKARCKHLAESLQVFALEMLKQIRAHAKANHD